MFRVRLICGPYKSGSVGDKSMKFGTDVLHMTPIDNQPPATKNLTFFKMAANCKNGYQLYIRFGLYFTLLGLLISPQIDIRHYGRYFYIL